MTYFNASYENTKFGSKVNLTGALSRDLDNLVTKILLKTKSSGNSYTKIVDYKIKTCDFINIAKTNALLRGFATSLQKYANFPIRCPFKQVNKNGENAALQILSIFTNFRAIIKF